MAPPGSRRSLPGSGLSMGGSKLTPPDKSSSTTIDNTSPMVLQNLRSFWNVGLAIAGLLSLLIFLVAAIPSRCGGWPNDGAQLLRLGRGQYTMERDYVLISLGLAF